MLEHYKQLVDSGQIKPDAEQNAVAGRLEKLAQELTAKSGGLFKKKSSKPKGLFIYGKVGRGKTMLMDAFYKSLPLQQKQRAHFHEFMQSVHTKLHDARARGLGIREIAADLATDLKLLCFDEYEVNDVTDAMILSKLFREMAESGVVFVFTSNKRPDEHYKQGLQRASYLEFCMYLQTQVEVISLDAKRDYRMDRPQIDEENYFTPLNYETTQKLKERFKTMTAEPVKTVSLDVQGRELKIRASGHIAIAEFSEICGENLGNADYIAIAQNFDVLFLENIPKMDEDYRNEARRFINLIDILYEHKTLLVLSAAAAPEELCTATTTSFEFTRTASRLTEMKSWKKRAREDEERF